MKKYIYTLLKTKSKAKQNKWQSVRTKITTFVKRLSLFPAYSHTFRPRSKPFSRQIYECVLDVKVQLFLLTRRPKRHQFLVQEQICFYQNTIEWLLFECVVKLALISHPWATKEELKSSTDVYSCTYCLKGYTPECNEYPTKSSSTWSKKHSIFVRFCKNLYKTGLLRLTAS